MAEGNLARNLRNTFNELIDYDRVARYLSLMGRFGYSAFQVQNTPELSEQKVHNEDWQSCWKEIVNTLVKFPNCFRLLFKDEYPVTAEGKETLWNLEEQHFIAMKTVVDEDLQNTVRNEAVVEATLPFLATTLRDSAAKVTQFSTPCRMMKCPPSLLNEDILIITPFLLGKEERRRNRRKVISQNEKLKIDEWRKVMMEAYKAQNDLLHIMPRQLDLILQRLKYSKMEIKRKAEDIKMDYFRYVVPQLDKVCDGVLIYSRYPLPARRNLFIVETAIYYCLLHREKLKNCLFYLEQFNVLERGSSGFWKSEINYLLSQEPDSPEYINIRQEYCLAFLKHYI